MEEKKKIQLNKSLVSYQCERCQSKRNGEHCFGDRHVSIHPERAAASNHSNYAEQRSLVRGGCHFYFECKAIHPLDEWTTIHCFEESRRRCIRPYSWGLYSRHTRSFDTVKGYRNTKSRIKTEQLWDLFSKPLMVFRFSIKTRQRRILRNKRKTKMMELT